MRTIIELKEIIKLLTSYRMDETQIVCHPDNLKLIKKICNDYQKKHDPFHNYFDMDYLGMGVEIVTDKNLPKFHQKWQIPPTPFIEYDEKDEEWARPINYGKYVDTDIPVFFEIVKPNYFKIFDSHMYKTLRIPNYITLSC